MLEIAENLAEGTVTFQVRVQPRASNDAVVGEMAGALKIRLQAPAVDGRANEALIEFLAQLLKTPKSAVRILSGDRSRTKRVEIRGVSKRQIEQLTAQDA
jgi:uncharacterized protein (TIGR00251 family)